MPEKAVEFYKQHRRAWVETVPLAPRLKLTVEEGEPETYVSECGRMLARYRKYPGDEFAYAVSKHEHLHWSLAPIDTLRAAKVVAAILDACFGEPTEGALRLGKLLANVFFDLMLHYHLKARADPAFKVLAGKVVAAGAKCDNPFWIVYTDIYRNWLKLEPLFLDKRTLKKIEELVKRACENYRDDETLCECAAEFAKLFLEKKEEVGEQLRGEGGGGSEGEEGEGGEGGTSEGEGNEAAEGEEQEGEEEAGEAGGGKGGEESESRGRKPSKSRKSEPKEGEIGEAGGEEGEELGEEEGKGGKGERSEEAEGEEASEGAGEVAEEGEGAEGGDPLADVKAPRPVRPSADLFSDGRDLRDVFRDAVKEGVNPEVAAAVLGVEAPPAAVEAIADAAVDIVLKDVLTCKRGRLGGKIRAGHETVQYVPELNGIDVIASVVKGESLGVEPFVPGITMEERQYVPARFIEEGLQTARFIIFCDVSGSMDEYGKDRLTKAEVMEAIARRLRDVLRRLGVERVWVAFTDRAWRFDENDLEYELRKGRGDTYFSEALNQIRDDEWDYANVIMITDAAYHDYSDIREKLQELIGRTLAWRIIQIDHSDTSEYNLSEVLETFEGVRGCVVDIDKLTIREVRPR